MKGFLQEEVRMMKGSQDPKVHVSLIITVEDNKGERFKNEMEDEFPETTVRHLAFSDFLVKTREQAVEGICDLDYVTSVQLDEEMRVLSNEDFCTQTA